MHRTTIMLPAELKVRIANKARKMKISMGQYIREALKRSLDSEYNSEKNEDPLYHDTEVYEEKTPRNLVTDHDSFLYGEPQ